MTRIFQFDPDVTRRDDGAYWAAALILAMQAGDAARVKIVRRKHPVSGLPYNATVTGAMVGDEEIRAALGEFP